MNCVYMINTFTYISIQDVNFVFIQHVLTDIHIERMNFVHITEIGIFSFLYKTVSYNIHQNNIATISSTTWNQSSTNDIYEMCIKQCKTK